MNFNFKNDILKIDLTFRNSDIELIAENRNDIEIDIPDLRRNTLEDSFDIKLTNNELYIKEKDVKWLEFFGKHRSSTLILKIPVNIKLTGNITAYRGDIKANMLQFSGSIKTYSGDITAEELRTEHLKIALYSGDVIIEKLIGSIDASLYSGDVTIGDGFFEGLNVKTYSGDLSIKNAEFNLKDDSSLATKSGDIRINISKYMGDHELSLKTLSGYTKVTGDYPTDKVQMKSLKAVINKSSKEFSSDNIFENIVNVFKDEIHSNNQNQTNSTEEDKESIMKILNMLEEGKIDAEKAEKLIKVVRE